MNHDEDCTCDDCYRWTLYGDPALDDVDHQSIDTFVRYFGREAGK